MLVKILPNGVGIKPPCKFKGTMKTFTKITISFIGMMILFGLMLIALIEHFRISAEIFK